MNGRRRVAAILLLLATPARADERLFERLAGVWSGGGSVGMAGGGAEPMRCRAAYASSGATRLHLDIACATDSFKLQIASDLTREGDRVTGAWREATYGVTGSVAGRTHGDRLDAVVSGLGVSARLSLALRGASQSVTLASGGQIAGTATVTLRRR